MKIAHINIIFSNKNMTGVINKLKGEAEAMKKYDIDMYVLNREIDGYIDNIYFIKVEKFLPKFFKEIYIRGFKYLIIDKVLNLNNYNYFILRYTLVDFSAFYFAKKYHNKIITEHHTKELEEIKVQNIKEPFKSFQYLLEKYFAKYFFKRVYGIIGISNDVVNSVKKRTGLLNLKSYIFSNGLKVEKPIKYKKIVKDKTIEFIFVASIFQKWHGLDRLLESLRVYDGRYKIILHLVGDIKEEDLLFINNIDNTKVKIIIYGKIKRENIIHLYNRSHIAIDSLAMFRIGMMESSTLKSKEYIKYGLPFLFSAPDPDMKSIEKYLFNCGNRDNIIDLEIIINKYLSFDQDKMLQDFNDVLFNVLNWDIKILNLKKWIYENK